MSGRIFISYRRGDDSGSAGRLFDALQQAFGADRLFIDVDDIEPGLDFLQVIEERLAQSDVMLAVIGNRWSEVRDEDGNRRLDNPADFVRLELEVALAQNKRVIPVLVGDARMLSLGSLPASLRPLARRNAVQIRHERFRSDIEALIKVLKRILDDSAARSKAQIIEAATPLSHSLKALEALPSATDVATAPISDQSTPGNSTESIVSVTPVSRRTAYAAAAIALTIIGIGSLVFFQTSNRQNLKEDGSTPRIADRPSAGGNKSEVPTVVPPARPAVTDPPVRQAVTDPPAPPVVIDPPPRQAVFDPPARPPVDPTIRKYDTGATNTEIKVGNIMAYSGPASVYGAIGKAEEAYFKKVNDGGGINGRKINFISYDDSYSPPKAVEQARKLIEGDEVLLLLSPLGTPSNSAIQKYLNVKAVPQLFPASAATKWGDPQNFPWTMGWQPSYQTEGRIFAKYILQNKPGGKIAILYQNDDYGKDYLKGLKDGLGDKAASMVVAEENYGSSEPTIDAYVVRLKWTDADIFINISTPKFAIQAIKKAAEIGWKPMHFLNSVSASAGVVLKSAGFDNAQGIISAAYMMDPADPQWRNDAAMKEWTAFMDKYNPDANKTDGVGGLGYNLSMFGYNLARTLVQVLTQCGNDLTRENVMKQAANLKDFVPGPLLPGIKINTSPTDFFPIEQMQLMKFEGETWKLFGPVMTGAVNG